VKKVVRPLHRRFDDYDYDYDDEGGFDWRAAAFYHLANGCAAGGSDCDIGSFFAGKYSFDPLLTAISSRG
jgi:hypothetical protein